MNSSESGSPLRFDSDIKPLFRQRDRDSMHGHFDLWSADEVRANGDAIFDALKAGSMPCDGEWPADRIALLGRWLAQGGDSGLAQGGDS